MRILKTFTVEDIVAGTEMTDAAARALIRRLVDDGHVEFVERRKIGLQGSFNKFAATTSRLPAAIDRRYYWQSQAWTAMRIHRQFRAHDILRTMEQGVVSTRSMRRWLKALARAGYVRQMSDSKPGKEIRYQMISDEPKPPIVALPSSRREVTDD